MAPISSVGPASGAVEAGASASLSPAAEQPAETQLEPPARTPPPLPNGEGPPLPNGEGGDEDSAAQPGAKRQRVEGGAPSAAAPSEAGAGASGSTSEAGAGASGSTSGAGPLPKLFKLTEAGSLAPSGAETLARRVGEATDESGAIVPLLNELTLQRYRAIGRVCALALVNGQTLGLPFARYFLRLVLREPPSGLAALQAELQHEDPSFLGRPEFLETPLQDIGMAQMMTFSRQVSSATAGASALVGHAPLAANPNMVVTDADKPLFLRRSLEHQLVRTIAAQADSFREGVEDVTGCAPPPSANRASIASPNCHPIAPIAKRASAIPIAAARSHSIVAPAHLSRSLRPRTYPG